MPGPRRRPIVLVAHGDPDIRAALRAPLEEAGLEVVEAGGVTAGISHAVAIVPDLVMLSADDETLDPSRAVVALQSDEHLVDTPLLLVSSHTDRIEVIEALAAGAHDVLCVPASDAEIVARAEAALTVGRLQADVRARVAELADLSRVDQLTGLSTRHHAEEHIRMLAGSARRQGHRISVVLLDVDHLRRVNTDLARPAGDAVLREIARRVQRCLRADDLASRWGGEEFLLLLPATELSGAWILADRIRRSVADSPISVPGGEALVTVSGGCADGDGADMEEQLRRADAALDAAKEAGRNRVLTDPTS